MGGFFTHERFGRPQVFAGLLLLIFLAECVWLAGRGISRNEWDPGEEIRLVEGVRQWSGGPVAGTSIPASDVPVGLEQNDGYDPNHSPLWYLVASLPLAISPGQQLSAQLVGWLARAPYLLFGVLLGGSLWYVSRRLYGDAGGYIALVLYCFSPGIIRSSAVWSASPEIGAAWGAFGAVFTAIAAAHTLYAPREVVLWNWRRILLLGLSLALAIGSQFSLIVVVPIALAFMLYLARERRVAAVVIWASACGIGLLLLYASYFFHPGVFWQGMRHANFLAINWRAFAEPRTYEQIFMQLGESSPALIVALPLALVIYLAWLRARYFGNTSPLLVAALLLVLGLGMSNYPGLGFQLIAVPFLFVFVAGVLADLLETGNRNLVLACAWGLCVANALWCVWELVRAGRE
jgi:hypothetical protein